MCHVTHSHGEVQGSTCAKTVASLYILQRSRSLHSQSQFSPCFVRQVPARLHQLSPCTLSSLLASSSQSTWHLLLHCRSHGCLFLPTPGHTVESPSLSACPHLDAWPRTSYVISYLAPPMMCYFCQFPHIFYFLSAAVFCQGKSSRGIWGGHPPPYLCHESLYSLKVTHTFYPGWQHSYQLIMVMQSILNAISCTSPFP